MSNIFISSSYKDQVWLARLQSHLERHGLKPLLSTWDDQPSQEKDLHIKEMETALENAYIFILLISIDYISSHYWQNNFLPNLLEEKAKRGIKIFPIIIRPCAWEELEWLNKLVVFPKNRNALADLDEYQVDQELTVFTGIIARLIPHDSLELYEGYFFQAAKKIISFLQSTIIPRSENYPVQHILALKILKSLDMIKLEPNFKSIYLYTLVNYSLDANPPELTLLFSRPQVINFFQAKQHDRRWENLNQIIAYEYTTDSALALLKEYFKEDINLYPEIQRFKDIFNGLVLTAENPFQLKLYNEMQLLLLNQLNEREQKSFPFQAEQYMKTLVESFEKDFWDKAKQQGLYIDLNGETRVYWGRTNRERMPQDREAGHGETLEEEQPPYQSTIYKPLDRLLQVWLENSRANFLLIVGEYGTGKSTFLRHLAHELALARQNPATSVSITDKNHRLPLFFPLRDFEKNIQTFIINQFNQEGIEDINYPGFLERVKQGELLLMLDGFDEMTQGSDGGEKQRNFEQIRSIINHSENSKVILTVRQEYFRSLADMENVVKHMGKTNYEVVYLLPFTDAQMQAFLQTRISNPQFYWEHIEKTFDLKDLAKRPVLLQLIVDHLPRVLSKKGEGEPIDATDLYRQCIDDELSRKSNELRFIIPDKNRLTILERLAVWMFLHDTLSIDVVLMESELKLRDYFHTHTAWEFEKYLNEFLTFTFLIREGDNRFRMSHKSFRDYMTASVFVREIESGEIRDFGKKKTTQEINHFIRDLQPGKEKLVKLVESARNLKEENRFLGGNAANILLRMDKKALKGRDLSGCQLPGVDFYDCDLTGTNLHQAELRDCLFNETILKAYCQEVNGENSRLDLENCQLEEIEFIKGFKNLAVLNLNSNHLKDVMPLAQLTELNSLWLYSNILTDVMPLESMKGLIKLDLSDNQLIEVTPLAGLTRLRELNLSDNQLTDVTPLAGLTGLTKLVLSFNQLTDMTPLAGLTGLTSLDLSNNPLTDVMPLAQLKQLKDLSLDKKQHAILSGQLQFLQKEIPGLEINIWD